MLQYAGAGGLVGAGIAGALPWALGAEPLTVEAELLYQSIAYRWSENLRGYSADETQRFGRYYAENAAASASTVATATAAIRTR